MELRDDMNYKLQNGIAITGRLIRERVIPELEDLFNSLADAVNSFARVLLGSLAVGLELASKACETGKERFKRAK